MCREFRHPAIGTEHILLGLLLTDGGVAQKVLQGFNIESPLRVALKERRSGSEKPPISPPFTPHSKKVLEMALREALQLGQNFIGTEHILLGIVRAGEGGASQFLDKQGIEGSALRKAVIAELYAARSTPKAVDPVPTAQELDLYKKLDTSATAYELLVKQGEALTLEDMQDLREFAQHVAALKNQLLARMARRAYPDLGK